MFYVIEYFAKTLKGVVKVIRNDTIEKGVNPYHYFVVTMSASRSVSDISSVK